MKRIAQFPYITTAGPSSKTDRVEVRIKELYIKLKITQVMRDNAKTI